MFLRKILKRLIRRRAQLTLFSGLAITCLAATAILSTQVFLKLDEYGNSNRDDIQFTMAQLEIEQLKLINAIVNLQSPEHDKLQNVRRRFDVLYSRVLTLKNGNTYNLAFADPDPKAKLAMIYSEIERMVPIIDANDQTLYAKKTELLKTTASLSNPIRQLAAQGLIFSVGVVETERATLTSKLIKLAALSILMLIALLSLMALLWRLYHLYRKRARQNRLALNRQSTILNTSQDAILVVDRTGSIIDTNGAAEEMFFSGKTIDVSPSISEFLLRKSNEGELTPLTAQMLAKSCTNGPNRCTNLIARDRSGSEFPVELSANRASRSGDDVCVCFIRDITSRLAVEAEIQSARDKALLGERAKARFLGMVSHEMRTPLNGILGSLDLLESTGLSKDQEQYSKIMKSSGQLLLSQINDALEATQADAGQLVLSPATFNLDDLLRDLLQSQQPISDAQGTTLALVKPEPTGELVVGDRDRVHQILLNLIANAIKFTRNGEITIDVSRAGDASNLSDDIEIQISDTGIGISEADLPHIFDDFVRVSHADAPTIEGTGLGLGIARHIVTLMGGKIGAESVFGEGSLFWVKIPLPKTQADRIELPEPNEEFHPINPLDILVVEDNATNSFVLCEMLKRDGHRIVAANDGSEGIAAADEKYFDLVLMDINMPGIDGIEATRQIRNGNGRSKQTCIVALTAHFQPEHNLLLRSAGFNEMQTKPIRRRELRKLLSNRAKLPTPIAQQAHIDWQILDQLNSVLPEQKFSKLLNGFETEGMALVNDLPELKQASSQQLIIRLHSFAGTAATLGAVSLQSTLCLAESAVLKDDLATTDQVLNKLPTLLQETLLEIQLHRRAA